MEINTTKTKEMVTDFRWKPSSLVPVVIHGEEVNIVEQYKYVGTISDNTLRFELNTGSTPTSTLPLETELIQCTKNNLTNFFQLFY